MYKIFARKKKPVMDQLGGLVIGLVTLGIIMAISFLIMTNVRSNSTVQADVNATAALNSTMIAMSGIPSWLPIIVIVVIGALLIRLVMVFRQNSR